LALLGRAIVRRVEEQINLEFNPRADDGMSLPLDHDGMTTPDYLINLALILLVLRQARERQLGLRSLIGPFALMFLAAQMYVHSFPTAGNDLVLVGVLASVGLTLGVLGGFATHVRAGESGIALARVGWIAGGLLVLGIGSRMVFVLALSHGAEPTIRSFSIAHQIGASAWPAALVSMALLEVGARIVTVHLRGRRLTATQASPALAAA